MKQTEYAIAKALYPDIDFEGDSAQSAPIIRQWAKGVPIRPVVADDLSFYSYVVEGINAVTFREKVCIVPACGNNERVKATIISRNQNYYLTTKPGVAINVSPAGVLALTDAFRLNAGFKLDYYGAEPLWAIGTTNVAGEISVAIERVNPTRRKAERLVAPAQGDRSGKPVLWQQGLPIREALADSVETGTAFVGSGLDPVQLFGKVGNNTRRRIVIIATTNNIQLLGRAGPVQVSTFGGTSYRPESFQPGLNNGSGIEIFTSDPIWAKDLGSGGFVSWLVESYTAPPL